MGTSYRLLVTEDSDDDRLLLQRALRAAPCLQLVAFAGDGQEAIEYLCGNGPFADRQKYPLPDLLLLDLKLPRKSGFDVLQWLQGRPVPNLRVVVFSSSDLPDDRKRALAMGAHDYRVKPLSTREYEQELRMIQANVITDAKRELERSKSESRTRSGAPRHGQAAA